MRSIAFLFALLLVPIAQVRANPIANPLGIGGFYGYITGFDTVTAPNTYSDSLATLPSLSLSGTAGWFLLPGNSCPNRPGQISCTYSCGGYNYVTVQFSGGSIAPQTDNLSGANGYAADCPLGVADYTWNKAGVTGYVEALDVGLPNSSTELFEGIAITFSAPNATPSAPYLVNPGLWSGTGTFFFTKYSITPAPGGFSTGPIIAGYKGTFNLVPLSSLPEPSSIWIFLAGLAGVGVAIFCRRSGARAN